jgi:HAD superfamily hydrolase (TIGR01662 family)
MRRPVPALHRSARRGSLEWVNAVAVNAIVGQVTYRPLVALCVLLDLNGTLAHPIRRPSDAPLRPLPGALDALALLHRTGAVCAIVTVQGRIGRGILTERDFRTWFSAFSDQALQRGGHIQGLYLCPHAPMAPCECRKPRTVLYERAMNDLSVTPNDVLTGSGRASAGGTSWSVRATRPDEDARSARLPPTARKPPLRALLRRIRRPHQPGQEELAVTQLEYRIIFTNSTFRQDRGWIDTVTPREPADEPQIVIM